MSPPNDEPRGARANFRVGEGLEDHRRGSGKRHEGVDLFAPLGTPIRALAGGQVLRVINGLEGGAAGQRAGWYVDVLSTDGFVWRYLHLDPNVRVHEGQSIRVGTLIGAVGTSGIKHAKPHVHLEKRTGDRVAGHYGLPVNPLPALDFTSRKEIRMDWKGILDKTLTVGGPILAKVADAEAPGAGGLVIAGTTALDEFVVKPYVPGDDSAESVSNAQPKGTIPVRPTVAKVMAPYSSSPDLGDSKDAQRAYEYLLSKGWKPPEAEQHVRSDKPAISAAMITQEGDTSAALWARYVAQKRGQMPRGEEDDS